MHSLEGAYEMSCVSMAGQTSLGMALIHQELGRRNCSVGTVWFLRLVQAHGRTIACEPPSTYETFPFALQPSIL